MGGLRSSLRWLRLSVALLLLLRACVANVPSSNMESASVEQMLRVGTQSVLQGKLDEGVQLLRHVVALDPASVAGHVYLGTGLLMRDEKARRPGMHRSNPGEVAAFSWTLTRRRRVRT